MTITAKIIADSISTQNKRMTTLQLRYPKFVHGEAKTHRKLRAATAAVELLEEVGFMDDPALSRNASSSRAIPVARLIEDVKRDPVMPVFWGANQPGMQADQELTGNDLGIVKWEWENAMKLAINQAQKMANAGAHKQIVNRILEPYSHINVVVSATDWKNFFHLRLHPAAQPEMRMLAAAIAEAMALSSPRLLTSDGGWHLPYVLESELRTQPLTILPRLSAARCARVSYLTHEGKQPEIEADLELFGRLVSGDVVHASPLEHQAFPDTYLCGTNKWASPELHGNLTGFCQFRKMIENEAIPG
jgi:hypothetical protein